MTLKTGIFQMRKDERFDRMQAALASESVGKNNTERVMMGLSCLCEQKGIKVKA